LIAKALSGPGWKKDKAISRRKKLASPTHKRRRDHLPFAPAGHGGIDDFFLGWPESCVAKHLSVGRVDVFLPLE